MSEVSPVSASLDLRHRYPETFHDSGGRLSCRIVSHITTRPTSCIGPCRRRSRPAGVRARATAAAIRSSASSRLLERPNCEGIDDLAATRHLLSEIRRLWRSMRLVFLMMSCGKVGLSPSRWPASRDAVVAPSSRASRRCRTPLASVHRFPASSAAQSRGTRGRRTDRSTCEDVEGAARTTASP